MIRVAQADLDAAHKMWMLSLNYGSRLSMAEVCAKHREDAYLEERAKIVALLHEHLDDWCKKETESGDIKHQYHQGSDALERLLWAIEAGEHLK